MALGRPGLEPCVPLEVRFRVAIDQWSRAEQTSRLRLRLSLWLGLVLPTTLNSKIETLHLFFFFLLFNLQPQLPFPPAVAPPSCRHLI